MKNIYDANNRYKNFCCLHLSNHFFIKGDYKKARLLIDQIEQDNLFVAQKSELDFVYGRLLHAEGQAFKAKEHYAKALSIHSYAHLRFNLSQLDALEGNLGAAHDRLNEDTDTFLEARQVSGKFLVSRAC